MSLNKFYNHKLFIVFRIIGGISFLIMIYKAGKGNSSQFLDLSILQTYLDSLGLIEVSAFFPISVLLLIMLITFNILTVFFSNEIIRYFSLKEKYPKLNSFFRLRQTYQRYYLMLNIIAMFIICLLVISLDLLILI